jgi:hypothetical protein
MSLPTMPQTPIRSGTTFEVNQASLRLLLLNIFLPLQVGDVCELLVDWILRDSDTNEPYKRRAGEQVKIINKTALITTVGQI